MKRRFLVCAGLLMIMAACHRQSHPRARTDRPPRRAADADRPAAPSGTPAATPDFAVDAVATREGDATWYDVPDQSLPQRKAWQGEMTAASDVLPQDSYARVRRLDGKGEAVVVRITDDGVHRKHTLVDVSRAAAEALGIVKKGTARVRVETLALKNASADKPVEKKDEPAAPKLTNTPAVSQQAEKDAAAAKINGASAP